MQSYIVTTYLLRQAGLASGDYKEKYAINPTNAILATYYQQVDAAGSADNNLQMERVKNLIDVSQLRFLALSQQLPQLPWAVSRVLSPELRMQIHEILTTMDQTDKGRTALHAASLDKIIPAHDKDFDPFRRITWTIRGEQF